MATGAQVTEPPSPNLAGIAHVAFRTANLEGSLTFYETLGFVRAFELTKDGKPTEEFVKINDRQFIELYPESQANQPIGLMHVCYEAADLEALHSAYVTAGLNPPAVKKAGAGNLLFSLRGPDGSVIEFTQYLPGSMHSNDRGLHLGEHRISTKLVGVALSVQDPRAWTTLFRQKLHFTPENTSQGTTLALPSNPGETVSFRCSDDHAKSAIMFSVASLISTAADLRTHGIAFERRATTMVVKDPDQNLIDFVPQRQD